MTSVVITGGCGYVGTYLATYLAEKSHFSKIILFDIAPPFCKIKSDKIEIVKGDITKPSDLKSAFQNRNIKGKEICSICYLLIQCPKSKQLYCILTMCQGMFRFCALY